MVLKYAKNRDFVYYDISIYDKYPQPILLMLQQPENAINFFNEKRPPFSDPNLVNFTNILRVDFLLIFLCQKNT